jgi:hypothetical protein
MNINTSIGLMQKSTKLEKKLGTIRKVSKQGNQVNETIRELSKKAWEKEIGRSIDHKFRNNPF